VCRAPELLLAACVNSAVLNGVPLSRLGSIPVSILVAYWPIYVPHSTGGRKEQGNFARIHIVCYYLLLGDLLSLAYAY